MTKRNEQKPEAEKTDIVEPAKIEVVFLTNYLINKVLFSKGERNLIDSSLFEFLEKNDIVRKV